MRPTAELASALVRPALVLVLTNAVPGDCRGGGGEGEGGGGDGGDGGEGGEGGGGGDFGGGDGDDGGDGGGCGGGGGAGQAETGPWTPVRVIAQEHTTPPAT